MSSKFMKSCFVLGTALQLAGGTGSKPAEKKLLMLVHLQVKKSSCIEDQYKAFAETVAKESMKESGTKLTSNLVTNGVLTNFLLTTNQVKLLTLHDGTIRPCLALARRTALVIERRSAKTDDKTKSLVTATDGRLRCSCHYRVTCYVFSKDLAKETKLLLN